MMPLPLVQAVVDALVFFSLSGDEVVNPDAAVEQLEHIASYLKELSDAEKQELLEYFRKAAAQEGATTGNTAKVDFLSSLGECMGLC